ncbi:MAG: ribokinase [Collinsella sp.]|nr:ribokinase [Collinsella sp.]
MKILNIGSLNIDYVYDVEDFVCKGQTISSSGQSVFAGGKGLNQSIALGRAGATVYHAGRVGLEGSFLKRMLAESGVNVDFVREVDGCPSGHAIIQRDHEGDNCIVLFGGANHRVDEAFIDEVLAGFGEGDWLLLQNETSSVGYAIEAAKRKGMWVVLNPSPMNESLLSCPLDQIDCFILNEGEASQISGCEGTHDELLDAVHERFPKAQVVLTVGSEGSLCRCGDEVVRCPALKVEVADTTAAGDTFAGYYLAELATGSSPSRALKVASVASAIAVSREGAAPSIPQRNEVEACLLLR